MSARRHAGASPAAVEIPRPAAVDLHTHTSRSDGIAEPADLVASAAAAGVRTLSITDHDTLAGYRELAPEAGASTPGRRLPLELIPGVEINAVASSVAGLPEGELHILGYGVDPDDEPFEALLARQREARVRRFRLLVERLREIGLPIDAQIAGLERPDAWSLGRPVAARCLVAAGHAASVADAFDRILGHGRPGYVPRAGIGPLEAIAAARAAGGLAVLAHFSEAPQHRALLAELHDAGLGGLEVHYLGFSPATIAGLAIVAAELDLVATGGSDYHGDLGLYADAHARLWVPEAAASTLRAALGREEPHA